MPKDDAADPTQDTEHVARSATQNTSAEDPGPIELDVVMKNLVPWVNDPVLDHDPQLDDVKKAGTDSSGR